MMSKLSFLSSAQVLRTRILFILGLFSLSIQYAHAQGQEHALAAAFQGLIWFLFFVLVDITVLILFIRKRKMWQRVVLLSFGILILIQSLLTISIFESMSHQDSRYVWPFVWVSVIQIYLSALLPKR
jgi:hypothetical protein